MALWHTRPIRKGIKGLMCLMLTIALLRSFRLLPFSSRPYNTWTWTTCPGSSPFRQSCTASWAAVAQATQVVVKTGGSEPQDRLRSLLKSVLSDVPQQNIVIFSDMEEKVESHQVHDVYADLSEAERAAYPEFALYDAMQEYRREGKDTRRLGGGWDLAKYMNLAMKRKLWTMHRRDNGDKRAVQMKWFVFIDTDTFIEWENLFVLLEHLDDTDPVYLGSPVWLPKLQFAHGGSAYVLSYGAAEALNSHDKSHDDPNSPLYSQYGYNTTALCCGDEALARVLKTKGVSLTGYWPMFNGEVPSTLSFGKGLWCEPVISLHHLDGKEMQSVWQWIAEWKAHTKSTRPLLVQDLFHYIAPHLTDIIEDWDNTPGASSNTYHPRAKAAAHTSFAQCRKACEADHSCLQFVHDGTSCALSSRISLGRRRLPVIEKGDGDDDAHQRRSFTSGWLTERIRDWAAANGNCASAHWLVSNP